MTTTTDNTVVKTDKMVLLEVKFGKDIRELISEGSVREVGYRLGVYYSTISRWRRMLDISR